MHVFSIWNRISACCGLLEKQREHEAAAIIFQSEDKDPGQVWLTECRVDLRIGFSLEESVNAEFRGLSMRSANGDAE